MPILKLTEDDPQKELEFEIQCALEIPASERLNQWLEWNISMLEFIKQQEKKQIGVGIDFSCGLSKRITWNIV